MDSPVVGNVIVELRKVKAQKLKTTEINSSISENDVTKDIADKKYSRRIKVGFKKSKDMIMYPFFLVYEIPSYVDEEIEIEAEFVGKMYFADAFDLESGSIELQEKNMKEVVMPAISKKIDEILEPIFVGMKIDYSSFTMMIEDD